MKREISIIGMGRFGQTLLRLLGDDFKIKIYDINQNSLSKIVPSNNLEIARDVKDAWDAEVIFLAVPISNLEKAIADHHNLISDQLIIDVLSVKKYPKQIYKKHLKNTHARVLLSHPMFGPDSSKDGFANLPIVLDQYSANNEEYDEWKKIFRSRGLNIIEMSAEEHDRIVAKSQAMTHIIGRVLGDFGFVKSEINTKGDRKMLEIIEQTCHDDPGLFYDMQNKNPYTRASRKHIQKSINKVFESIVKHRYTARPVPIYGIQGGRGSFNDEAIHQYFRQNNVTNYQIAYLHTTKRVLDYLDENEIDFGLFAVSNSRGGIVEETTEELGKHRFQVEHIINIPINHYMMALPGTNILRIKRIMAHPQVFKQCQENLAHKYPEIKLESGRGSAIDNAKIAELLVSGKLGHNTAVMGPKRVSDIYGLEILDSNLQDDPRNTTNFLLVK